MSAFDAPLDVLQALVAMVLLGVSLVGLGRAGLEAVRIAQGARWLFGGALVLAALLRAIAPLRIATVFSGYQWTAQAIALYPIPRYGAGAFATWHALFAVLPRDHHTIMAVNAGLGVLIALFAGAWTARIADNVRAGAIAALFVAAIPLLIKNDTSDAKEVPMLVFLFAGLLLWQRDASWLGVALLALAAISRPEMPAIVVALAALSRWKVDRTLATRAGVFALAIAPHLVHVALVLMQPDARDDLPGLMRTDVADLWRFNTLITPSLFPIGVLALACVAPIVNRRTALLASALLGIALLAVLVYLPDVDRANMARVHAPAALIVACTAAIALAKLPPWMAAAIATLALATAIPNIPALWHPTNDDAEEAMIRALHVPRGALLLRGAEREGNDPTHEHFPDYLFPGVRLQTIESFLDRPDFSRPVYAYVGMRCYARFRMPDEPRPHGTNEQPWCTSLRTRFVLEPMLEREVENRGDVWIDYYGDARSLRIGLYRLTPAPLDPPPAPLDPPSRSAGGG